MDAKDEGKARRRARAAGAKDDATAEPGTADEVAELESQDDWAYLTGQRDPKGDGKQVRSPGARRQAAKTKEAADGEEQ